MFDAHYHAKSKMRRPRVLTDDGNKKNVILVGAGITNLMTAELLATRSFKVCILDAGPNPKFCTDWTRLGATSGGGNARMFSPTEADNYNEKRSKIYHDMQSVFRKTVRAGGWSVKSPKDFTSAELEWVNAFETVPAWLAQAFQEDIHHVNLAGGRIWRDYIQRHPRLFEDVGFRKNIVRVYEDPIALDASVQLSRRLNALVEIPSKQAFLTRNPTFQSAGASNHVSGGFTVDGFTINIHPFVAKLIDRITQLGGEFHWDCPVKSMQRNGSGEVTALESRLGEMIADHFVVSVGATGSELLRGTASENLVHGVMGVWLHIPNLGERVHHSVKIHRRGHTVEDVNVTVSKDMDTGQDVLVLGGGYGYVGLDRPSPQSPEVLALFDELEEVARVFFPHGYAAAKQGGTMYPGGERKFCVRPFTPTGLGLFERIPCAGGGHLIITGGNNTGGFAQAPATALATWRMLVGEHDPIHVLFNPQRGRLACAATYRCRSPPPAPLRAPPLDVEAARPLGLLLLCSDGPQHMYLRHRLQQVFPGFRCIVETHDGQARHLMQKKRRIDALCMKYHSLRHHVLGSDSRRKAYFDRLVPDGCAVPPTDLTVDSLNCRQVWNAVEQWRPELTVVSGTKYIGPRLTERAGLMINLHTGYLPDYRGNHCIFFALCDGAVNKVSATLHQLTSTLDGGAILDRVFPPILPDDTEETLHVRCMHMAMERCIEHLERFAGGQSLQFVPQETTGRMFRHRDRTPDKDVRLWWKLRMSRLLENFKTSNEANEKGSGTS